MAGNPFASSPGLCVVPPDGEDAEGTQFSLLGPRSPPAAAVGAGAVAEAGDGAAVAVRDPTLSPNLSQLNAERIRTSTISHAEHRRGSAAERAKRLLKSRPTKPAPPPPANIAPAPLLIDPLPPSPGAGRRDSKGSHGTPLCGDPPLSPLASNPASPDGLSAAGSSSTASRKSSTASGEAASTPVSPTKPATPTAGGESPIGHRQRSRTRVLIRKGKPVAQHDAMQDLTDAQRMKIMLAVKSGALTMDEAIDTATKVAAAVKDGSTEGVTAAMAITDRTPPKTPQPIATKVVRESKPAPSPQDIRQLDDTQRLAIMNAVKGGLSLDEAIKLVEDFIKVESRESDAGLPENAVGSGFDPSAESESAVVDDAATPAPTPSPAAAPPPATANFVEAWPEDDGPTPSAAQPTARNPFGGSPPRVTRTASASLPPTAHPAMPKRASSTGANPFGPTAATTGGSSSTTNPFA